MAETKIYYTTKEGTQDYQNIDLISDWEYTKTIYGELNFVLFRGNYGKGGGKQTNILGLFWWNRYPTCFPNSRGLASPLVVPEIFEKAVIQAALEGNGHRVQRLLAEAGK